MSLYQNHIGLSFSCSKLQLVEVNYNENSFYLENVDEEYFNEFINLDSKETQVISILQNAFNELQLRKPIKGKAVSITLPNEFFKIVEIPYEKTLIPNDLKDMFKWNLSILYPDLNTDDFVVQHIDIKNGNVGSSAIVIGVNRRYLKALHKFCVRNNLVLKYIDNAHIASNAYLLKEKISAKDILLSIYVSEKNLSVMLLKDKKPIYFTSYGFDNIAGTIPIISKSVSAFNKSGISTSSITSSFIAGENISDTLLKQIQETCGLPIVRFNPFNKIKAAPHLIENDNYSYKNNSYSAATGIALRII
ncbi:MAG: hypothetical protein JEY94_05310 [Melioribacteraceae bacterium]|nr:hypothetical protein [Melioribacteraceae bacterium]